MASRIPAQLVKQILGLTTKTQAVHYINKFGMKYGTNRAIKNKTQRQIDFLHRLKKKIDEYDEKIIQQKIIRTKVADFIIESDDNPNAILKINLGEDLQNRVLTLHLNGKNYKRKSDSEITGKFLLDVFRNINNNKEGKFLYVKINYLTWTGGEQIRSKMYYVVNAEFIDKLRKMSEGDEEEFYKGFGETSIITNIEVYYKDKTNIRNRLEGGFFPFKIEKSFYENPNNKHIIEILKRCQIYGDIKETDINDDENCLIHTFKLLGLDENIIKKLMLKCKSSVIPLCEVKKIARENKFTINISNDKHDYNYENGGKVFKMCLLKNHYFINEKTDIMQFAIKNYQKVKDQKNWWEITGTTNNGKSFRREKRASNNTYRLVQLLMESNILEPLNLNEKTIALENYKKIDIENINLDNETEQSEYELIIPKEKIDMTEFLQIELKNNRWDFFKQNFDSCYKKNVKIGFDFETSTDGENHKAYMISSNIQTNDETICNMRTFTGSGCGLQFLNHIHRCICKYLSEMGVDYDGRNKKKNKKYKKLISRIVYKMFDFTIMAHNITYDLKFLEKYISNYRPILRSSNKVCGGSFMFKGLTFKIKDTYAVLDCRLADFKDYFNLINIK